MYLSALSKFLRPFSFPILMFYLSLGLGSPSILSAAPQAITSPPSIPLEQVQHIRIETLALTERGLQNSDKLKQVISQRLAAVGFTPTFDRNSPHDIVVRVKCEERKARTGPSKHRKGGHPLSTASRLWKGPACQISYRHQDQPALWSWEVRTSFENPRQAAKAAGVSNAGLYALQELQTQLAQDEFPLYLAAEWKQADRLIHLFQQTADQPHRKRLILQLLGSLTSPIALATIQKAIHDPTLAMTAIQALGNQGEVAIPILSKILDISSNPEQSLAALKALGGIATHSPVPTLYDEFLQQLQSPDPRMQTIAVKGLGALGNQSAIDAIEALNIQAWSNPSTHADMQALREALNDALYQLDPQASSH